MRAVALAMPTALRVAIRVGEALEALHHNRLLHGQLGPDSVLMVNDGERIRLVGVELSGRVSHADRASPA